MKALGILVLAAAFVSALAVMPGCEACGFKTAEACGVGKMHTASVLAPNGCRFCAVMKVEKTAPDKVVINQPFTYDIKVTNLTSNTLHDVVVYDRVDGDINLSRSDPEATASTGGRWSWNIGDLGPYQTKTVSVSATAAGSGKLASCANVTYNTMNANELCMNIEAINPTLALNVTAPSEQLLCDTIPVKFVVINTGSGQACNVVINSALPEGWQTTDGKTTLSFVAGNLNSGQSKEFDTQIRAQKTGTFTSESYATADGGLRADARANTTVVKPELSVTIAGPKDRYIDTPITYTITVVNGPDATATNTVLTNALPPGTTFVSASEGGQFKNGAVTWDLGTLGPRDTRKVELTLKSSTAGDFRDTASVTASCGNATAEAMTSIKGISGILFEMVDLTDPIQVGQKETYRITVTNQGSMADTNILITAKVPEGMKLISASGATEATSEGNSITFKPLASLAPKEKAVWNVVVEATSECDCRFEAQMKSDTMTSGQPVMKTESTRIYK